MQALDSLNKNFHLQKSKDVLLVWKMQHCNIVHAMLCDHHLLLQNCNSADVLTKSWVHNFQAPLHAQIRHRQHWFPDLGGKLCETACHSGMWTLH